MLHKNDYDSVWMIFANLISSSSSVEFILSASAIATAPSLPRPLYDKFNVFKVELFCETIRGENITQDLTISKQNSIVCVDSGSQIHFSPSGSPRLLTLSPTATATAPFLLMWFQLRSKVCRASLSAKERRKKAEWSFSQSEMLADAPKAGPRISPVAPPNSLWLKSRNLTR